MQATAGDVPRPSITVDALVFAAQRGLRLLLVRRAQPPFEGCWALPGGFIGEAETAEQAARRCLAQKTGLDGLYLEQLYTFTQVRRDPRERVISVAYLGMTPVSALAAAKGGLRTQEVRVFDAALEGGELILSDDEGTLLHSRDIAFDHADMIRLAIERMRGKLEYTGIAFEFLEDPGAFTLAELQGIYEAIAGKKYDTPNFRRFIKMRYEAAGRVVNTGRRRAGAGKSAALYAWRQSTEGEDGA